MKRMIVAALVLMFAVAGLAVAQDEYDSNLTVQIMRDNVQAFGQLRSAAGSDDFLAAAGALAKLAEGSLALLEYEPPRGSEDEWYRIHYGLIDAALKGIIACGNEDGEGLSEAIGLMGAYNREGHGDFK